MKSNQWEQTVVEGVTVYRLKIGNDLIAQVSPAINILGGYRTELFYSDDDEVETSISEPEYYKDLENAKLMSLSSHFRTLHLRFILCESALSRQRKDYAAFLKSEAELGKSTQSRE